MIKTLYNSKKFNIRDVIVFLKINYYSKKNKLQFSIKNLNLEIKLLRLLSLNYQF